MNLKTLPLAKQISIAGAALVALIVFGLVATAAWFSSHQAELTAERTLAGQADNLRRSMEIAYQLSEESTTRLADLFESRFKGEFVANPTQTVTLGGKEIPQIIVNGQTITGQYSFVDNFTDTTGGIATVFVKVGEDYLRASTSLKKEDGSRAVGTMLDRKHPGYAAVKAGKTYIGEAVLFGKRYMTKYLPVKSSDGKTDFILFIGFDMDKLFGQLKNTVLSTRVGDSGVPFVLYTEGSKAGELLIHENLQGNALLKQAESQPAVAALMERIKQDSSGTLDMDWTNPVSNKAESLFVAYSKSPMWAGATVIAPAVKSEIFGPIYKLSGLLIALGLIASIGIAVALYWVTNTLTASTKGLTALALRLGNGDMTARADEQVTNGTAATKNEISLLARSMNRMADSMEQALAAVKESTERVQSASENLVQTSDELSKGAASESDAASGMAAAVEEMSSSIASVGDSATEAKDVTYKARQLANDGLGAINSANQQMHQISDNVQSTASVIQQLGEQSREISEIALIIKGIAEQTNLLALNAAIEAARAGEQGRGFSVVADEVRKLAERTRKSTDDIHGMIEAIQKSSEVAVNNMEMAVDSVEKGVQLVDRAGSAMQQITTDSSSVAHAVENIHAALQHQNQASNSIGQQVEVVARLSESNLDMARQAKSAVDGLKGVASDLSAILKRFQVKGGSSQ
ncbi:MAG TPA: methyl-accepting chemotaxis protein [Limnobacter sp.]|uniref:methyl-accepting chemotaxis protein n=1 Tax=Limnobacter sp. TaxID=2003368 RepID=UPI002ED781B8